MPQTQTILQVFVASPSDVAEERKILGEVIDDINQTASDAHTLRLKLLEWETDSYPGFGEDAQDVINQQIGDDYDIFLGIMWGRFGSPTPRAGSGTEEEFDRAVSRWKDSPERIRIMFYFKKADISSSADPEQIAKVQAFKKKISSEGGLYHEFHAAEEFRTKARRHLTKVIQDWPKPALSDPETAETTTTLTERRVKAAEDNVRVAQEGHITEGFTRAIEHLGHESDSVRLGGAYELFHLARDTPDLRQTVLDILCAHIRRTTGEPAYRKDYKRKPSEEIQSLLTLLFVQEYKVFTGLDINLQGSCLNGSNLRYARLEKAHLFEAQLHEADLSDTQLHGADLRGAQLHGADLREAQLHGTHLEGAQLHRADLSDTQLHGTHLFGAQLHGAHLVYAQLYGADLEQAQLYGAHLFGAGLHEADLMNAQLHGASSDPMDLYESLEASINKRIGEQSDLSGAISAGGLTPEAVASIGKGLPDEDANELREKLKAHIGKPKIRDLPENSSAFRAKYTKEEAALWIAEYKTALCPPARDYV